MNKWLLKFRTVSRFVKQKTMGRIHYLLTLAILGIWACSNTTPSPGDPIPEHDTFILHSSRVGEKRTINVWVPAAYKTNGDSLPVMYMADGGIQEDFPHIANTLAQLILEKKIRPVILVGIENTQRRRDLTGFTAVEKDKEIAPVTGGSENFRNFIKDELFPEINKRYRTRPLKGILGESLSGLFVMETFFNVPDMFDIYIAFDPSLWWNNHHLVETAEKHVDTISQLAPKRIWFAGSGATDISPYTRQLASVFKNKENSYLKWHYLDAPEEKHTTIFRATKEKAFIWSLGFM